MSKTTIFSAAFLVSVVAAIGWLLLPMGAQHAVAEVPKPLPAPAEVASADAPLVLELFTSQGCSSCPPADALAAELAKTREDILVISRPVTYWDRLGWKDTLAKEENTDLQRAYARRGLAGRNGVYTPQAVIDGEGGTVGSSARGVDALLREALPLRENAPVLALSPEGTVHLDGVGAKQAQLSLVALDSEESVSIALGENRNRTITYTNYLVKETVLGRWSGGKSEFALPSGYSETPKADIFALILREGTSGRILTALRL